MQRRTFLNWAAYLAGALRLSGVRGWAQAANFPAGEADTLRALAAVVLPSEAGAPNAGQTAEAFIRWVRGYRAGAEMITATATRVCAPRPLHPRRIICAILRLCTARCSRETWIRNVWQ